MFSHCHPPGVQLVTMVTHQYQAVCVHSVAAVHGAPSTCCVTCWLESVNVRMGSKVSHVMSVKRGASSRKASACVSKYIRHTHTPHTHRHTLTWDMRLTCSFLFPACDDKCTGSLLDDLDELHNHFLFFNLSTIAMSSYRQLWLLENQTREMQVQKCD